jgi:hypothetical protein
LETFFLLCVREAPLCTAPFNTSFFIYPRISKNIARLLFIHYLCVGCYNQSEKQSESGGN